MTLDLAFATLTAELDRFLDYFETGLLIDDIGVVATEYRVVVNYGGRGDLYGLAGIPLGVVNKDFAIRKANEQLRDHAVAVSVEARPMLRGDWTPVASGTRERLLR